MKAINGLFLGVLVFGMMLASGAVVRADDEASLKGAGATFPYPLYSKWISEYNKLHPGVRINYQAIGSGGGIKQITDKTADFGASDGPMTDEQLSKAPGILHLPMTMGGVVPIYNVPGVSGGLKFSGPVLADIYLGKLTKWNDARIKEINPGVTLPDMPIIVVHRADGSGTSYIFTDYLSKVSLTWEAGPGKGTSVKWPTGIGGKGSEGVSGVVKQTPGTIGYVEMIYATKNGIAYGDMQNAAGKFVHASDASVTAAAAGLKTIAEDLRLSITNAEGDDAYPISGFTWVLVYKDQSDMGKAKAMVNYFWWCIHDGQALCRELGYAPLPKEIVERCEQKLKSIKADGVPVLK